MGDGAAGAASERISDNREAWCLRSALQNRRCVCVCVCTNVLLAVAGKHVCNGEHRLFVGNTAIFTRQRMNHVRSHAFSAFPSADVRFVCISEVDQTRGTRSDAHYLLPTAFGCLAHRIWLPYMFIGTPAHAMATLRTR